MVTCFGTLKVWSKSTPTKEILKWFAGPTRCSIEGEAVPYSLKIAVPSQECSDSIITHRHVQIGRIALQVSASPTLGELAPMWHFFAYFAGFKKQYFSEGSKRHPLQKCFDLAMNFETHFHNHPIGVHGQRIIAWYSLSSIWEVIQSNCNMLRFEFRLNTLGRLPQLLFYSKFSTNRWSATLR